MGKVSFIVGGARSGKSRFALEMATEYPAKKIFLATAEASDDEMAERILNHQEERNGAFITIEEPREVGKRLTGIVCDTQVSVILIDCLTVWLGNLFHYSSGRDDMIGKGISSLVESIEYGADMRSDIILVANEVGLGVVPETPLGRLFRDKAGWLNQRIARAADTVHFCVSGIATKIKG